MRAKLALMLTPLLVFCMSFSFAQERTISGNVTDQEGLPLPGVSVVVIGTSVGTQTDFDGNYVITASSGQVLRFSYIGQTTVQRTVSEATTINVQLEEDAQALAEVVVTGALNIERRPRELSYAVAAVQGDELTKTRSVNAATAIVGKVSGLQINTTNNGVNPSTRVVLRGNRSLLGDNEALIVVDGYPSSRNALDRINPNDIEDISILKGANAAALYGSDASNGVIMITTKRGKGKLSVEYNTSFQAETVAYMPEFQDKYGVGGFPDGTLWPLENVNWGPAYDGRMIEGSEYYEDENGNHIPGSAWMLPYTPIKNNHKNFFRTGSTTRHGVTLSGGDDNGDFLFSLDQSNVEGVVPKDRYNRTNVRLSGNRKFDKLEVGGTFSFFRSHANTVAAEAGRQGRPLYWNVINTPLHLPMEQLKNWRDGQYSRNEVSFFAFYENPYFIVDTQREVSDVNEFNYIGHVKYNITDWMSLLWRGGYTNTTNRYKRMRDALTYEFELHNAYSRMAPYGANVRDRVDNISRFNNDFILNIDKDLNDQFNVNLNIGQNLRMYDRKYTQLDGGNLSIPGFWNVNSLTTALDGVEYSEQWRKVGVYGDLTIGFNDYLFLNVTARNDWSSTLPMEDRSFFYPGAGVSFVASDAFPALKSDRGLSYMKFNFNVTKTGNDPNAYAVVPSFYAPDGFPFGVPGLAQDLNDRVSSSSLKPEFTTSMEAGVEMQFFRSRLTTGITAYQSNSTDQIVPINIANSSGANSMWTNIGEIQNQGIEVDLKGTIISSEDFGWNMGLNYTLMKSEVLSLTEGVDQVEIGGFAAAQVVAQIGQPFPMLRTTVYERDDQGRVIVGANGNPIQSTESKIVGKTSPDYIVGLNTNLRYKNFNLYAVMDYRTGHYFFNGIVDAMEFTGLTQHSASSNRQPFIFPNSSYSDGSGGFVANTDRPTASGGNAFWDSYNDVKENYVTDATTLKIREILLSYDFDGEVLERIGVQNLSLGLFGRNLFTFRPKDNVYTDPEFNFTTGNAIGVGDQGQTPPTRQYGLSLSVKF